MNLEVIVLGCGSSAGTPVIGCHCPTCSSDDKRNQRTRASTLISANGVNFLIDTGPDLRQQALRENIERVDAVLYTHPHSDHLNGIDDLRAYCYQQRGVVPLFGNAFTLDSIQQRFPYAFFPPSQYWDKPVLSANVVEQAFEFQGIKVTPIPVMHGTWPIYGYRIGNVAYITDVSAIPDSSRHLLQGLDLLLLDSLRRVPHPTHFSFEQAVVEAQRIGAQQTLLIHMTHELSYQDMAAALPDNIVPAYDGLRIVL
jgi:phosphoribosyl 1,2-cyclic phosphate phosphodiesterase